MANTSVNIEAINRLQQTPVSAILPTTGQVLQFNGTSWVPTTFTASLTADNGLTLNSGNLQLKGNIVTNNTNITTKVLVVGDAGYDPAFPYKNFYNVNFGGKGNVVIGSDSTDLAVVGPYDPLNPFQGNGYDNSWHHEGKLMILNKKNTLGTNNPTACLYIRNQNPGTERGIYMQNFNADQVGFTNYFYSMQIYNNDPFTFGFYTEIMPFCGHDSYLLRQEMRAGGVVDLGNTTVIGNLLPLSPASIVLQNQARTFSQGRGNAIEIGNAYGTYIGQWGAGHGLILQAHSTEWDLQNSAYKTWTSNEYQSLFIATNGSAKKVPVIEFANQTGLQNTVPQLLDAPLFKINMQGNSTTNGVGLFMTSAAAHVATMLQIQHSGSGDMIFAENLSPTNTGNSLRLKQQGTGFGLNVVVDHNGYTSFGIADFELTTAGSQHKIGVYNAGSTGWAYKGIGGTYTVLDTDTYLRITFGQTFGTITLGDPTSDFNRGRHIYIDAEGNGSQSFTCTTANGIDNPLTFTPTTTYNETAQVRPSWEIISSGVRWKINTISRSL